MILKRVGLTLLGLLIAGFFAGVCLWYAAFDPSTTLPLLRAGGAKNLLSFYVWFIFVIFLIGIFVPSSKLKREKESYIPWQVWLAWDVVVIVVLVAQVSKFLGLLFTIATLISVAKRQGREKAEAKADRPVPAVKKTATVEDGDFTEVK